MRNSRRTFLGTAFKAAVALSFSSLAFAPSLALGQSSALDTTEGSYNGKPLSQICNDQASAEPASSTAGGVVDTVVDTNILPSVSADDFYSSSLGDKQFILFGDMDHSDSRIPEYIYSKQHIDRLADLGVKHFFIERMPVVSQGLVDALVKGDITTEEYASSQKGGIWERGSNAIEHNLQEAEGILYYAQKGIAVHSADVKGKSTVSKEDRVELYKFIKQRSKKFGELCPDAEYMTDAFAEAYDEIHADYLEKYNPIFETLMQERYDDTSRVELMKSIAGEERSAVLYGAAHYFGPKSIKTLLGEENTLQVFMLSNAKRAAEYGMSNFQDTDFGHIIDEDSIYQLGPVKFQDLDQKLEKQKTDDLSLSPLLSLSIG